MILRPAGRVKSIRRGRPCSLTSAPPAELRLDPHEHLSLGEPPHRRDEVIAPGLADGAHDDALEASGARVLHHTPDIGLYSPAEWCVLEYASPKGERAYAGVFRLGPDQANEAREYIFRPRGIDPSRRYAVTFDNRSATIESSGADLVLRGIPVRLDGVNLSELLLFEAL